MPDELKPSKHGRDHCPGGEDPIPCLGTEWVRRTKTSSQVIANGTNDTEILWDDPDLDGSDNYATFFTTSTPTDKTIRVLADGIYVITAELQWSGNKVEGSVVSLVSTGVSGAFTWNKGWYDAQNASHTIEHNQTFTYRRRLEANATLQLYIVHFASASRTIQSAWWEVHHVGSYTGTANLY